MLKKSFKISIKTWNGEILNELNFSTWIMYTLYAYVLTMTIKSKKLKYLNFSYFKGYKDQKLSRKFSRLYIIEACNYKYRCTTRTYVSVNVPAFMRNFFDLPIRIVENDVFFQRHFLHRHNIIRCKKFNKVSYSW